MTRGIIYCRQSRTQRDNFSLNEQEKKCREFCRNNKIKAKKAYKESNRSARNMKNRNRLDFITSKLNKGDVLIVPRVDRISRHYLKGIAFLRFLKSNEINVYSVDENINLNENFNEFQKLLKCAEDFSNEMSMKMNSIVKNLSRKGWHFGMPVYGYKITYDYNNVRKIKKDNDEQNVINFMLECVKNGDTYSIISRKLNRLRIKNRGKFWNENKVGYVIRQTKNRIQNLYQKI